MRFIMRISSNPTRSALAQGVVITAAAGVLLLLSTPVPASSPDGCTANASSCSAIPSAATAGYRVELDEAGKPVVPTGGHASTATAPAVTGAARAGASPAYLLEQNVPGAGVGVAVGTTFHTYSVARIGADGRAVVDCKDAHGQPDAVIAPQVSGSEIGAPVR